ncbi:hypothetical protein WR25_20880 [Diploscapter pachys]|uniref:Elongation of very long chain fatty acids protein n=1 Tax=Diploscapter pachys TaxID=2018661 RepID=A0A2A2JPP2_9BILA|nr:hypothetical protein WR25_20880 [Diploscapter pachys]
MDLLIPTNFNYERAKLYAGELESFSLKLTVGYMITIFSMKYLMRDRKPFELTRCLNIWNGILAVFSLLGFLFTFPTLLSVIYNRGLTDSYAKITELQRNQISGYWVYLWVLSKIPELVDTIFIVLRKRPLIFMHWYHHALTGYYALVCYHEEDAHMVWVVWMNYAVHAAMYSYYLLRSLGVKVSPVIAQAITTSQMIQFLIAIAAQLHVGYLQFNSAEKYAVSLRGWIIGFVMLTTYFYLWVQFYKESYINRGGKKYAAHKEKSPVKKSD